MFPTTNTFHFILGKMISKYRRSFKHKKLVDKISKQNIKRAQSELRNKIRNPVDQKWQRNTERQAGLKARGCAALGWEVSSGCQVRFCSAQESENVRCEIKDRSQALGFAMSGMVSGFPTGKRRLYKSTAVDKHLELLTWPPFRGKAEKMKFHKTHQYLFVLLNF